MGQKFHKSSNTCPVMYIIFYIILQTNSFQCVLAMSEFESFVIFLYAYERVEWTTGGTDNGLGGTEALAGINAGDGVNFISIPGSLTPDIINIYENSNVGMPGKWIYKTGQGKLRCL